MVAIQHACRVLKALGDNSAGLTVGDLILRLGLPKTTLIRVLRTLQDERLVERDEDAGSYHLSLDVFRLGASAVGRLEIRKEALPIMRRLVDACGETVALFVRSGHHRVCIEKVDSPNPIRRHVEVGEVLPLHCSSSGKLFLAFLPEAEVEDVLRAGLVAYTPSTITDPMVLRRQLQEIRAQGYAVSYGERVAGGIGISAPVRDRYLKVVAALTIAGPDTRIGTPDRIREFARILIQAAEELSSRLGAM